MRILVFGDSVTQGFHDTERGGWCSRLINFVMQREIASGYSYNKSIFNLGVAGDTTEDLCKRIKSEAEARLCKYATDDHDVLLLAIGINDSYFEMTTRKNQISVETMVENLGKMITDTREYFEEVAIIGIAPVVDERVQPVAWDVTHGYSNVEIAKYNKALETFAAQYGFKFIDLNGVYGDAVGDCLPDGVHPNADGHGYIYNRVKSFLEAKTIL